MLGKHLRPALSQERLFLGKSSQNRSSAKGSDTFLPGGGRLMSLLNPLQSSTPSLPNGKRPHNKPRALPQLGSPEKRKSPVGISNTRLKLNSPQTRFPAQKVPVFPGLEKGKPTCPFHSQTPGRARPWAVQGTEVVWGAIDSTIKPQNPKPRCD